MPEKSWGSFFSYDPIFVLPPARACISSFGGRQENVCSINRLSLSSDSN